MNDLIQCNSPYTLVNATSINDDGVVAASALVRIPSKNIFGEVVLDSNGDEVIVDRIISVRLEPIAGGSIEDCDVTEPGDDESDNDTDRQGAGFGLISLLGLIVIAIRRRIKL